jgi:hypothetical protein
MLGLVACHCSLAADGDRVPARLNVSVAIFDPGIPENRALHRDLEVFPRVRKIEALYLPFVLRRALVAADTWGAVRVVPDSDVAAELLVYGTIAYSDGDSLKLDIRVIDASGRVWVERLFSGPTSNEAIYSDIAAAMAGARAELDNRALRNIIETSLLRYAQQLAPAAFDEYLQENSDATYSIRRLPASNDPMLARIERLRGVEYVFTDAVDAKFRELSADVETVYDLWREYRRQFNRFKQEESLRVQTSRSNAERGSYAAMVERYEVYKWDRQAAEEQDNWAIGFENEMGPTIAAIEERVDELEGWVESRYAEWQRILGELFELETELPD